jgi:spermidine synthase
VLVGMEIPLVMRILNQRRAEFRELVSRVLTFDYLGALAVSLLLPLVLARKLGMSRSALLFGMLNTGVAIWTAYVFRREIKNVSAKLFARQHGVWPSRVSFCSLRSARRLGGKRIVR